MSKGKILFFDDDKDITGQFADLMNEVGFEIITFNQISELRKAIADDNTMHQTKALVFDLANNETESSGTKGFEILKDIYQNFNRFRIPIFIHSAFSEQIEDFKNCGTVWKVEKSGKSLSNIVEIIEQLDQSGFIEAFTPNGIIERSLMLELHKSFTEQFRKGEIEKILDAIKKSNPENFKERSILILKRIAIKSLNSELLSPIVSNDGSVNPIEHFYRRISKIDFWTGDIWTKKDKTRSILILTPRCDLANGKATLLVVCDIVKSELALNGNKQKRLNDLRNYLTDNLLGKATRYLPATPLFDGGMVNLSTYHTVTKQELSDQFDYNLTVSDELTNEIIGKFAYYFLRTGITTISTEEFDSYLEQIKDAQE
jgi:hypothetical protein